MTRPIDAFTDQPPELFNQTVQLKNELAEAKAEVERLASGKWTDDEIVSLGAKLSCTWKAIASTREQQLTAATQAREAAQQRAEKAEQEVRLFEEIYGGGAESISKALHDRAEVAESRVYELEAAIRTHWEQKADDRCWEDDSKLYAVVPLPDTTNRCIGDPAAMNELEQQLTAAQQAKEAAEERAEKAEREHEGTLKERVECEECIDKMYLDVVGQPAQWSNNFDYKDAADMVEQVAFARDQEIGRHINAREVAESRVCELEAENAKLWKNDELKAGIIAEEKAEKAKLREQLAYLATDAGPDSDAAVIKQLREEVASVKRGYDQLDKNWHAVHESAMTAIRQMFCNPDATVPEICEEIGKLREKLTRVNQENRIKEEQVARCVQVVRGPARLGSGKWCVAIAEERSWDVPGDGEFEIDHDQIAIRLSEEK